MGSAWHLKASDEFPVPERGWILDRLTNPCPSVVKDLEDAKLTLWSAPTPKRVIEAAADYIALQPDLAGICAHVTKRVTLLSAPSGFDVSHSEPRWETDIFVSIPDREDDVGAIRLTESIVHEAMHLHLTNYEFHSPIILNRSKCAKSPWRAELRPVQGVMHGLFVFRCLYDYFQRISHRDALSERVRRHCASRVSDIREEILSIQLKELNDGLTSLGCAMAKRWRNFEQLEEA